MRRFAMVLLLAATACSPAVDIHGATSCKAYLDCLAETDPETFEDELEVYGNNGSCFADGDEDDCQTACLNKLDNLGEDGVEACEPPPEPSPNPGEVPEPDANGDVDCAAIVGGPTVGPGEPGPLGFPEAACNPRASGVGESRCCSDDPASVGGGFPQFEGLGISGGTTPYFAGANNSLGTSGLCVRTEDIPSGAGLQEPEASGCPIPCNPTWDDTTTQAVCGADRSCCQTRVMRAEDCVQGEDGQWRPVTGQDVLAGLTDWRPTRHATHQDPNGQGCGVFAGSSDTSNPDFTGCIEELTVANQRGYCMALGPEQCPGSQDSFIDACEQINLGLLPPPG